MLDSDGRSHGVPRRLQSAAGSNRWARAPAVRFVVQDIIHTAKIGVRDLLTEIRLAGIGYG